MGMSAGALSTPLPGSRLMASPLRQALAAGLGRVAYGLFYAGVAGLVIGLPAAAGFLVWHWLTH